MTGRNNGPARFFRRTNSRGQKYECHCGRGDDFKSQVLFHGQRIGTLRFSSQVRQQAAEVNTMAAPCQSPGKSKTFYGFRLA